MVNTSHLSHRRILIIAPASDQQRRVRDILTDRTLREQSDVRLATARRSSAASPLEAIQYDCDSAFDGESAVRQVSAAIDNQQPYELMLVNLPIAGPNNCVATIQRIWELDAQIQTILCLAQSEPETRVVFDALGVSDRLLTLHQPYQGAVLKQFAFTLTQKWRTARQLSNTLRRQSEHIRDAARVVEIIHECERELAHSRDDLQVQTARLSEQLRQRVDEILGTRDVMVFALERLAESRDAETGEHLERLRAYSQILAEELAEHGPYAEEIDSDFLRDFALSTPLHDIGKVGVPDCILRKPARLDAGEFDIMKQHTLIGAEALRAAAKQSIYGEFLLMAADIAHWHHERFDGTGYPDGLSGVNIPLPARIVAVADVFDALTSRRVYKDEQAAQEARDIIVRESGQQFDPQVVTAFERRFQDFLQVKNENFAFSTGPA